MISQSFIFNIIHYSTINQHYRLFHRKLNTIVLTNKKQQIIHDSLLLMHSLYHQHNPSFCLDKHIGKAADNGINLIGCNWLSILADMQSLAVNHFCNLLRAHPSVDLVFLLLARHNTSKLDSALSRSSVLACEAIKYSFFDFHLFFHHISPNEHKTTITSIYNNKLYKSNRYDSIVYSFH